MEASSLSLLGGQNHIEMSDRLGEKLLILGDVVVERQAARVFLWFIRGFGGIANRSITEVCPVLHPEGMSAISRGLSARDTPGSVRTK